MPCGMKFAPEIITVRGVAEVGVTKTISFLEREMPRNRVRARLPDRLLSLYRNQVPTY